MVTDAGLRVSTIFGPTYRPLDADRANGVLGRRPAAHGRDHRLRRLAGRGDGLRLQRWGVDAVL